MLDRAVDPMLLRGRRPPQIAGAVTTIALVGACAGLVYLAIAKGCIETNGGGIPVESILGQGTSFVVDLPTVAAKRPAVAPAARR